MFLLISIIFSFCCCFQLFFVDFNCFLLISIVFVVFVFVHNITHCPLKNAISEGQHVQTPTVFWYVFGASILRGEHQHDQTVSSISWKFDGECNVNKLERWLGIMLRTKAQDMFRYKGVLAVKGMDTKFVFQGVHMLFSGGFQEFKWKPDETRSCRFVFIGRNLDKADLEKNFLDCKVTCFDFQGF